MGVSGESKAPHASRDEAYCATCSRSFGMEATNCPHDGTKLVRFKATEDAMLGTVLDGRYQILKPLGEGGMGTVYRGTQLSVDREVAIKVVHPSIATEREAAKRFLREARLASRLNSPNIVNVIDFGQSDNGLLYLVMELVKGTTLAEVLAASSMLYPPRAAAIMLQLCDALEAAHSVGIVHRDLKPSNVIVLDDPPGRDYVKVLDFGLAKAVGQDSMTGITNTHSMLGTPVYMAPEQIEGAAVDGRTDLYALGCMFYELIAGTPPFTDTAISALFAKHLHEPPPPLPDHVSHSIAAVVMRMLEKAPAARFPTAAAVRDALHAALAHTPPAGVPIQRGSSPVIATPRSIAFAPTSTHEITPAPGTLAAATPAHGVSQYTVAPPDRGRRIAVIGGLGILGAIIGIVVIARGGDRGDGGPQPAEPARIVEPANVVAPVAPIDAAPVPAVIPDASIAAIPDAGVDAAQGAATADPTPIKKPGSGGKAKPTKSTKTKTTKPAEEDLPFLPSSK